MVTLIFQSGDPILTVYETNAIGRLGLPRALTSQQCVDNNPAGMLWSTFKTIVDYSQFCNSIDTPGLYCV